MKVILEMDTEEFKKTFPNLKIEPSQIQIVSKMREPQQKRFKLILSNLNLGEETRARTAFIRCRKAGYASVRETFMRDLQDLEANGSITRRILKGGANGSTTRRILKGGANGSTTLITKTKQEEIL